MPIWDAEAIAHMDEINRQEQVLTTLHDRFIEEYKIWLTTRPGRESITSQQNLLSAMKDTLIARLQGKLSQ